MPNEQKKSFDENADPANQGSASNGVVVPAHADVAEACADPASRADGQGLFSDTSGRERPEGRKLFFWCFLGVLAFSLYMLFILVQPFIHSIILACVFTAISFPFYLKCLSLTGGRRIPAALAVLLVIAVLIIILIAIFVAGFLPQAKTSIAAVNKWLGSAHLGESLNEYVEPLLLMVQEHFPGLKLSLQDIRDEMMVFSTRAGQYVIGHASAFVGNLLMLFAHAVLVLLLMFFLFINGEAMLRRMSYLLPMKSEQTAVVIDNLRRMSKAVLVGGFSVALLQGIAGGIGLAFVGIPPLFWGLVMTFAAFVPVMGTGLVWGPAVIYLLIMKEWQSALFLGVWCGVGVASIDSILRPLLLRDEGKVPVLFLFMAILGGVNAFGILGLLYGPMILGFGAVMLDIYAEEYHDALSSRSVSPCPKDKVPEQGAPSRDALPAKAD